MFPQGKFIVCSNDACTHFENCINSGVSLSLIMQMWFFLSQFFTSALRRWCLNYFQLIFSPPFVCKWTSKTIKSIFFSLFVQHLLSVSWPVYNTLTQELSQWKKGHGKLIEYFFSLDHTQKFHSWHANQSIDVFFTIFSCSFKWEVCYVLSNGIDFYYFDGCEQLRMIFFSMLCRE